MKIVFTGGGSGGHFYPIIAVAQEIQKISKERKLIAPKLFYIAPHPYDKRALFELDITFKKSPAGKARGYFSLLNFFDIFKTLIGILRTIPLLFSIYPDVIFSKGGYASFPTLFAARLLRIPVVIHESDAAPGRVNTWSGKFAEKIAVAYPEVAQYFKKEKVAYSGNPVRRELHKIIRTGGADFFKFDSNIPTILIIGGSQGAQLINENVLGALPQLVEKYQVIHQTGKKHLKYIQTTAGVILEKSAHKERYLPIAYLNTLTTRMAAGAADIIVSRAGAGAIAEIALWETPSILVPITKSNADHQNKNAFSYARAGGAVVIKEKNLTPNVLMSEITRIIKDKELQTKMSASAREFARPDASTVIAKAILGIALKHER